MGAHIQSFKTSLKPKMAWDINLEIIHMVGKLTIP